MRSTPIKREKKTVYDRRNSTDDEKMTANNAKAGKRVQETKHIN